MTRRPLPVIITRSEPGASRTAISIEAPDFLPLVSPVIRLRAALPASGQSLARAQNLIFTSANGVRYFTDVADRRDHSVWCVGEATAEAARQAGFTDIRTGPDNAEGLARHIRKTASPDQGGFLHIANRAAGGGLAGRLQQAGFAARVMALYESVAADDLTPEALAVLARGEKCAVMVHSARGADAFCKLAGGQNLSHAALVAISAAAASPLANTGFGAILTAEHPGREGLMLALGRVNEAL